MKQKNEATVREERVSMTIALSPGYKRFLKVYAAEHDTTVTAVITEDVKHLRKKEAGK